MVNFVAGEHGRQVAVAAIPLFLLIVMEHGSVIPLTIQCTVPAKGIVVLIAPVIMHIQEGHAMQMEIVPTQALPTVLHANIVMIQAQAHLANRIVKVQTLPAVVPPVLIVMTKMVAMSILTGVKIAIITALVLLVNMTTQIDILILPVLTLAVQMIILKKALGGIITVQGIPALTKLNRVILTVQVPNVA